MIMTSIAVKAAAEGNGSHADCVRATRSPEREISAGRSDATQLMQVLRGAGSVDAAARQRADAERDGWLSETRRSLRCALLTWADVSRTMATVPLRWDYLFSGRDKAVEKRFEHCLFLNFVVNSWLGAAGIRYGDIGPEHISIMRNYFTYITAVDEFIDAPENRARMMEFSKDKEIRGLRKEFFVSILALDEGKQREMRRLFTTDTGIMMSAVMKYRDVRSLGDAEDLRMGTSGVVVRTHIKILDIAYSVPKERARMIEDAYMNLGMAAQVHDDLYDLKEDMAAGTEENLVYQILLKNPDELERVKGLLKKKERIRYSRLVEHAPVSAAEAKRLQDKYVQRIPSSDVLRHLDSTIYIRELR